MTEIEIYLLFSLSRKVSALLLHARSVEGNFSIHARGVDVGALSPTARCTDDAFSLFGKCVDGVLREKNEISRHFSKMDEVVVYTYYLGEVAFQFLAYREDPYDPSS